MAKGIQSLITAATALTAAGGSGMYGGRGRGRSGARDVSPAQVKEIKTAFKEAVPKMLAKLLKETKKAGVPDAWVKKYVEEWGEEQQSMALDGMFPLAMALKEFNTTNAKDAISDYNASVEQDTIKAVKSEGEKIASNSSKKIALLKKLNLNGAEFHALCLMIKEQIR